MKKNTMKTPFKFLILFLFILTKSATAMISEHVDAKPENLMEYNFFISDDNKGKIRIQKKYFVPIYEDGEADPTKGQYFYEIIGEWEIDDPYIQKTFEFTEGYLCRYRQ
ncbi:MAG: hypothetical protein WCS92_03330 [Candidatus Babeliales bacterium]|jgi:hypothetical protein|nr:MAG: hypothetical protein US22_C0042G0004 [candidate division TM6 bacterium GW2011_GWF2_36_6]